MSLSKSNKMFTPAYLSFLFINWGSLHRLKCKCQPLYRCHHKSRFFLKVTHGSFSKPEPRYYEFVYDRSFLQLLTLDDLVLLLGILSMGTDVNRACTFIFSLSFPPTNQINHEQNSKQNGRSGSHCHKTWRCRHFRLQSRKAEIFFKFKINSD